MKNLTNKALSYFTGKREEAEEYVAILEKAIQYGKAILARFAGQPWWRIGIHLSMSSISRFVVWSNSELNIWRKRLAEYLKAEQGLLKGDYCPAISLLEGEIQGVQGAAAMSAVMWYPIGWIDDPRKDTPHQMYQQLLGLKNELILLQQQGA